MTNQAETPALRTATREEIRFLAAFFAMFKTARLVDTANAAFQNRLDEFMNRFDQLVEDDEGAEVKAYGNRFFLNDKIVRLPDDAAFGARNVVNDWRLVGIGGVHFHKEISRDEMSRFFSRFAKVKPSEDNRESLAARLKDLGMHNIELLGLRVTNLMDEKDYLKLRKKFREMARSSFFRAMSTVRDSMVSVEQDKDINVAKTKRVIHSLIDHILEDESSLIELTSIKSFDDYTYAHSTNVCVYSLTIGARIGMDRGRLSQLGFAALFHDVGKVKLSKDLITKPDSFDENDWLQMQRHPLLGAKTILRSLHLNIHTARAARVAFEHHINNDFTGYPQLHYDKRETTLFSKVVSIADTFDALTSGRVYIKRSIPPDEVIRKMRYQMKVKFDPLLLKVFTDIVGVYPAGSLVLLSTDEIALVLTHHENDHARPFVKIVGNRDGLLERPLWVDLSLPEHADRQIVRMIEPEAHGLDARQFILAD